MHYGLTAGGCTFGAGVAVALPPDFFPVEEVFFVSGFLYFIVLKSSVLFIAPGVVFAAVPVTVDSSGISNALPFFAKFTAHTVIIVSNKIVPNV